MQELYLLPSIIASIFLFAIAVYLLFIKPKKDYIFPLIFIFLTGFLWNAGTVLTNVTEGNIIWAELGTVGLIFIPFTIFHFTVAYTGYFEKKYHPFIYTPALLLLAALVAGEYVTGVVFRGYGYEPLYQPMVLAVNSWIGFFLTILSVFLLYRYYRENVGIKRRQTFYILLAVPANAILSVLSYYLMVDVLGVAQFSVGSVFDFATFLLILYAIIRFKLPVDTAAEIDFRILAETASDGICILDTRGCIEYSNTYFTTLVNSPERQVLGKPLTHFIPEEFHDRIEEEWNRIYSGKKITGLEVMLERENDGRITVELTAAPIVWNNEIIGSFVIVRNIEKRKKMEEELRTQRTYFQALFHSSPEAVVSMDERHRVLDVNPAFSELFGYTAEELRGKNIDDFILPEEERQHGEEITKKVIHGNIVRAEGYRKRKDGSLVYVSILGSPIFIEGKQVGIFGIYRDITARIEAEREREFYNSLLRHDIANKNAIILGSLELFEAENLTDEQASLLENAMRAAESSSELIEKIRNLHRIGREKELLVINVHDVITRVIDELAQTAESHGVTIRYTPIRGFVRADPLLENVFFNIIQNAIIHAGCTTITISGTEEKSYHKISIEDDGKGIPEDVRARIFMPQVKRKGSPGSGLGLYLVKKLVESYGGYIEVGDARQSKTGTVFDIYLRKET